MTFVTPNFNLKMISMKLNAKPSYTFSMLLGVYLQMWEFFRLKFQDLKDRKQVPRDQHPALSYHYAGIGKSVKASFEW